MTWKSTKLCEYDRRRLRSNAVKYMPSSAGEIVAAQREHMLRTCSCHALTITRRGIFDAVCRLNQVKRKCRREVLHAEQMVRKARAQSDAETQTWNAIGKSRMRRCWKSCQYCCNHSGATCAVLKGRSMMHVCSPVKSFYTLCEHCTEQLTSKHVCITWVCRR